MEKYILLDATDILQAGDEFYYRSQWFPVGLADIGYPVGSDVVRRKVWDESSRVYVAVHVHRFHASDIKILACLSWDAAVAALDAIDFNIEVRAGYVSETMNGVEVCKYYFMKGKSYWKDRSDRLFVFLRDGQWIDKATGMAVETAFSLEEQYSGDRGLSSVAPAIDGPMIYVLVDRSEVVLASDEVFTDEVFTDKSWIRAGQLGGRKDLPLDGPIRRWVSAAEAWKHEWQILEVTEVIQKGDEWWSNSGTWKESIKVGERVAPWAAYRRRIQSDEKVDVDSGEPNCICPAGSDTGCENEIDCLRRNVKVICEENDGLRDELDKFRQEYRDLVDSFEALRKEKLALASQVRQRENDWNELDSFCKDQAESIRYYRELSQCLQKDLVEVEDYFRQIKDRVSECLVKLSLQNSEIDYLRAQVKELDRVKDGLARQLAQERDPEHLD